MLAWTHSSFLPQVQWEDSGWLAILTLFVFLWLSLQQATFISNYLFQVLQRAGNRNHKSLTSEAFKLYMNWIRKIAFAAANKSPWNGNASFLNCSFRSSSGTATEFQNDFYMTLCIMCHKDANSFKWNIVLYGLKSDLERPLFLHLRLWKSRRLFEEVVTFPEGSLPPLPSAASHWVRLYCFCY